MLSGCGFVVCLLVRCCTYVPVGAFPSYGETLMDNKRIDNWIKRHTSAGKDGLVLMVDVINDMAQHRNTDGAGRLMGKVNETVRPFFARLVKARFGVGLDDKPLVTGKVDASHANGYTFKLKFQGHDPDLTNDTSHTWGVVEAAVKRGASYDDKTLHKALRDYWKTDEDEEKPFDYNGKAKRFISRVSDDGGDILRMIEELKRLAKANKANNPENIPSEHGADTGDAIILKGIAA